MNLLRNELKSKYSQIPNELITDLNLCNGSLRVLLYLFTKPDDWNVYNLDICKKLSISEQTLTKYWKKLLISGWLKRTPSRDKYGKLTGGYNYLIGNFTVSIENTESVKSIEYSNNKPINKKETNKKEYNESFESLWNWYKEKTTNNVGDKKKAYSNFNKAIKKYGKEIVSKGIGMYIRQCKETNTYTKHLSTLLNEDLEEYSKIENKTNITDKINTKSMTFEERRKYNQTVKVEVYPNGNYLDGNGDIRSYNGFIE